VPQRLLRRPGRSPTGPRPSPARQQTLAEQTPATELEQEDSATAYLWPPRNEPTPPTRRPHRPTADTTVCRSSPTREVPPLGPPTTRQASSTTRPTRYWTTTTPNTASSHQPSAAPANDAKTAVPDRHTAIKRVLFPPDHDIARAPVEFIRPLLDRTGATLLHTLLRSADETGSAVAGLTSDELT
jgi:hypothetical protein